MISSHPPTCALTYFVSSSYNVWKTFMAYHHWYMTPLYCFNWFQFDCSFSFNFSKTSILCLIVHIHTPAWDSVTWIHFTHPFHISHSISHPCFNCSLIPSLLIIILQYFISSTCSISRSPIFTSWHFHFPATFIMHAFFQITHLDTIYIVLAKHISHYRIYTLNPLLLSLPLGPCHPQLPVLQWTTVLPIHLVAKSLTFAPLSALKPQLASYSSFTLSTFSTFEPSHS